MAYGKDEATLIAKNVARSAMDYLDGLEKEYGHGMSADNLSFGKIFTTECVNQIMNKLSDMPQFTIHDLNSEFKKLLKATSSLNNSEFAYGIDLFKETLQKHFKEKNPAVEEFFTNDNIKVINNEVFNIAEDNKFKTTINTHKFKF